MAVIKPGDFGDKRVKALLTRHLEGMHANSPPGNEATRASRWTGSGPAFEPAVSLYRKYGFTDGGAFDGYVKSPFNRFVHLDLV